jgi:hypothetical protein
MVIVGFVKTWGLLAHIAINRSSAFATRNPSILKRKYILEEWQG